MLFFSLKLLFINCVWTPIILHLGVTLNPLFLISIRFQFCFNLYSLWQLHLFSPKDGFFIAELKPSPSKFPSQCLSTCDNAISLKGYASTSSFSQTKHLFHLSNPSRCFAPHCEPLLPNFLQNFLSWVEWGAMPPYLAVNLLHYPRSTPCFCINHFRSCLSLSMPSPLFLISDNQTSWSLVPTKNSTEIDRMAV